MLFALLIVILVLVEKSLTMFCLQVYLSDYVPITIEPMCHHSPSHPSRSIRHFIFTLEKINGHVSASLIGYLRWYGTPINIKVDKVFSPSYKQLIQFILHNSNSFQFLREEKSLKLETKVLKNLPDG